MSVVFDTSVLVAGLVEAHPAHRAAFPWIRRVQAGQLRGLMAVHSLAETYSVLTTLPHQPRIAADAALRLIRRSLRRFKLVSLGARDYSATVRTMAEAWLEVARAAHGSTCGRPEQEDPFGVGVDDTRHNGAELLP